MFLRWLIKHTPESHALGIQHQEQNPLKKKNYKYNTSSKGREMAFPSQKNIHTLHSWPRKMEVTTFPGKSHEKKWRKRSILPSRKIVLIGFLLFLQTPWLFSNQVRASKTTRTLALWPPGNRGYLVWFLLYPWQSAPSRANYSTPQMIQPLSHTFLM